MKKIAFKRWNSAKLAIKFYDHKQLFISSCFAHEVQEITYLATSNFKIF